MRQIPLDRSGDTTFRLAQLAALLFCVVATILLMRGLPGVYASTLRPCDPLAPCLERHLSVDGYAALKKMGWTAEGYALYQAVSDVVYMVAFLPLAGMLYVVVVRRRPEHRWFGLLTACVLIALATILLPLGPLVVSRTEATWGVVYRVCKTVALLLFLSFLYTFPNGRLVWRGLLALIVAATLMGAAWIVTGNAEFDSSAQYGLALSLICVLCGVSAQLVRYRQATTEQRQQTRWLVFGFLIGLVSIVAWISVYAAFPAEQGQAQAVINVVGWPFLMAGPLALGVTLTVAVLRYRLWNVDVLINRTILYTLLMAFVAGLYVVLVSVLGSAFQTGNPSGVPLVTMGIVALSIQGVRDRLQRGVNRLMFGQRDEPLRVMERLGRQLKSASTPEEVLNGAVQTVTAALKVPYAAIYTQQAVEEQLQVEYGTPRTPPVSFPLVYQNEQVGNLVVGQRSPSEALSPSDQSVLANIAQQMSAVVHNVRLLTELQRSRERLVTAREEERRRLRRDLHDGLGPALASQTLKIDAALDLLSSEPAESRQLLTEVKGQAQTLVADIRRLVYELRPPALDEIGLAGALSGAIMQMRTPEQRIHFAIEMPEVLPHLPAAVEVATYRIVMEAITNVIKHANAQHCTVRIKLAAQHLTVTIEDDGSGLPTPHTAGIGLHSMRERAEELGGTFAVDNRTPTGTQVTVMLPIMKERMP